ncbi:LPS O-antigen chain length determinant protein WzzB [Aeromonas jandaei]|uniref:LPS O-antigen chain length determinant protein WzzB n=1 Tax=Aeromonas jandaei TaxID=650 RepID=UPI0038D20165
MDLKKTPTPFFDSSNDEIDLFELMSTLWEKRITILGFIIISMLCGIFYAITATEKWTASAIITQPQKDDLSVVMNTIDKLSMHGVNNLPSPIEIYDNFISEFNKYDNKINFLTNNPLGSELLNNAHKNHTNNKWVNSIEARPLDNNAVTSGITISVSSKNSDDALNLLNEYTSYIISIEKNRIIKNLEYEKTSFLSKGDTQYQIMLKDAILNKASELNDLNYAFKIAKAAEIVRPLTNFESSGRFSIRLGTQGLAEKISTINQMKISEYQPELTKLKERMAKIREIKITQFEFKPFSYLQSPLPPTTRDEPKLAQITILSTVIGGLLGVSIALFQHLLKQRRYKVHHRQRFIDKAAQ